MYTGEPLAHPQSPFDLYSTRNAPWDVLPRRPVVVAEALREEDEEQLALKSAMRDHRQAASEPYGGSPLSIPASASLSTTLSASPAAMFLSSFMVAPQPALKPDDEGQVIAGYTLGPVIGYGASSIIRRASSSAGSIAAVKIIRRSDLVKAGNAPQARRRLQHEATVWATLSHEHILPLFSAVNTPFADYFFTLYCPAGSLFDILQRDGTPALLQDDAGMMFRQVVRGLRYLHEEARYVHRDMKLENVLVDEMGVCKIGDFGMTRRIGTTAIAGESDEENELDDQQQHESDVFGFGSGAVHRAVSLTGPSHKRLARNSMHTNHHPHPLGRFNSVRHRNSTSTNQPSLTLQPGSLPYAAPELLLPHTSESLRPHPCQDIWALGVMLYALLTGRLPFADGFDPRLQMKILNGQYEVPKDIGRGAERILQGCLERSVANRWTIAMVDEVGWGVGWGAEGDDAHPSDHQEGEQRLPRRSSSASRSRSRTRPADILIPSPGIDWQYEEPRSQPSLDAAHRRSSSRAKRSLSRAPVLTDKTSSARSASHNSTSRRPRRGTSPTPITTSPSTSGSDPLSATSLISYSYEPPSLAIYGNSQLESALIISPTSSTSSSSPIIHRGRGRWAGQSHGYHSTSLSRSRSRSPSPSMVPATPQDGPMIVASPTAAGMLENPDELHLDAVDHHGHEEGSSRLSRGRAALRSSLGSEDSESLRVHIAADKEHGVSGFGEEGRRRHVHGVVNDHDHDDWVDGDADGDGDVDTDKMVSSVDSETLETLVDTNIALIRQQHRPSSSPPTASRTQMKDTMTGMEALLTTSAALQLNSMQRSRSADLSR